MSDIEHKIVTQIIQAVNNGTLETDKITAIEDWLNANFGAYTASLTKLNKQLLDEQMARNETAFQEKLAEIQPEALKKSITAQLKQQQADLARQQADFESTVNNAEKASKRQFWQSLTPVLAGTTVCLLLVAVIFFVLEKLIYQGIWNGWGLHKLYNVVIAIQPQHPYGAIVLGILGFVLIAGAIYASFWLLVHAVQQLVDFKPSKLLFWKKQNNTRW
ncbi:MULTISPECIES: hypothetical protein [Lactobacillaceae]|jgi:hypothetical protein|uniref:hypothetical protein n=1 Tax=Lactobacillaceae TaxID=33958 RepID=UPI00080B3A1F|nr:MULTISPECIES: hypothetical protein [Lactobacillaceae]HAQ9888888.1 hypothetical protein [Enterococcus faecium]MBW0224004.1 hypothetical protein [Lentilactobacillus parabuchneri]MCW6101911.1 hypothetical protein [Lactiplantibacillus plantarum]MEA0995823.1 hypothetical protein [Lactiplantibacillus plantarum]MEA1035438.1 hypothetical protein [Lactiplantibacillus plantarum]